MSDPDQFLDVIPPVLSTSFPVFFAGVVATKVKICKSNLKLELIAHKIQK